MISVSWNRFTCLLDKNVFESNMSRICVNVVFKSYTKFKYRFFFTFDFFLLFHLCLRCFNSFNKINVKIVYEYVGIILNLFKQKKVKQMTSVIVYYVYITLKY